MRFPVLLVTLASLITAITTATHICSGTNKGLCSPEQTIVCYQCTQLHPGIYQEKRTQKYKGTKQHCSCKEMHKAHIIAHLELYGANILIEKGWKNDGGIKLIEKIVRIINKNIRLNIDPNKTEDMIDKLTLKLIPSKHYAHSKIKLLLNLNQKASKQKVDEPIFEILVSIMGQNNKRVKKRNSLNVTKTLLTLIDTLLTGKQTDQNFVHVFTLMAKLIRKSVVQVVKLVILIAGINGYDDNTKNTLVNFLEKLDNRKDVGGNDEVLHIVEASVEIFHSFKRKKFSKKITLESIMYLVMNDADSKVISSLGRGVSSVADLKAVLQFINKYIADKTLPDLCTVMENLTVINDNRQIRTMFALILWRIKREDATYKVKLLLDFIIYILTTGKSYGSFRDIVNKVVEMLKLKGSIDKINSACQKTTEIIKKQGREIASILLQSITYEIRDNFSYEVCLAIVHLVLFLFGYGNKFVIPYMGEPTQRSLGRTDKPEDIPPVAPKRQKQRSLSEKRIHKVRKDTFKKNKCLCLDLALPRYVQQMLEKLDKNEVMNCVQNHCSECFKGVCIVCLHTHCQQCALDNCKDYKGEKIIVSENGPVPCWKKIRKGKQTQYVLRKNITKYCKEKHQRLMKKLGILKKKGKRKKKRKEKKRRKKKRMKKGRELMQREIIEEESVEGEVTEEEEMEGEEIEIKESEREVMEEEIKEDVTEANMMARKVMEGGLIEEIMTEIMEEVNEEVKAGEVKEEDILGGEITESIYWEEK